MQKKGGLQQQKAQIKQPGHYTNNNKAGRDKFGGEDGEGDTADVLEFEVTDKNQRAHNKAKKAVGDDKGTQQV